MRQKPASPGTLRRVHLSKKCKRSLGEVASQPKLLSSYQLEVNTWMKIISIVLSKKWYLTLSEEYSHGFQSRVGSEAMLLVTHPLPRTKRQKEKIKYPSRKHINNMITQTVADALLTLSWDQPHSWLQNKKRIDPKGGQLPHELNTSRSFGGSNRQIWMETKFESDKIAKICQV